MKFHSKAHHKSYLYLDSKIYILYITSQISLFGVFRLTRRKYEDNPESTFTPLPKDITTLGIELDPDTGVDLSNTQNDKK